jgi:hypothetical protein
MNESRIARPVRTLRLYVVAGVVYTCLGIWNQNYIYSYFEGLGFLCLFVVGIPALIRRLRR